MSALAPCGRSGTRGFCAPTPNSGQETMVPPTTADADATTAFGRVRPRALVGPLAVWSVLTAGALAVGWVRELVFPYLGGYTSHAFATQAVVGLVLAVSWLYFSRTTAEYSRAELLLVGGCWTLATVVVESLLSAGLPVAGTLGPYRTLLGPVWYLVPVAFLVAPPVVGGYLAGER